MVVRVVTAAAAALLLGCVVAGAQATSAPQGTPAPPATSLDGKPGSLSDKLGDTNGVIAPKGDVDPAMPKASPPTGSMPVIKPGQVPPQPGGRSGTP